ncbi:ENTH domain containing protein [Parasponia andersonii]|uniref:ENTH domain containing protein n=1 Tax=Parasponia andersonii TaxID=3476 RepID=A0A2P5A4T7_PARAD|nr:ENTH domain containing protein [Parasponia andersonii]
MAEEATNNDSCSPDARTMTRIAEASYGIDDYWRIVDVLHGRLYCVDWKQWRQAYKALALLEFLLTHGPEDFSEEFVCDTDVIQELGTFQYIDEKGFNWGANMQRKSDEILKLLGGGKTVLKQARLRALKVTRGIQGFGRLSIASPSSSSPSSSATSESSRTSSFGSFSTYDTNTNELTPTTKEFLGSYSHGGIRDEEDNMLPSRCGNVEGLHIWDCTSIQEKGSFLEGEDDEEEEEEDNDDDEYVKERDNNVNGFVGGIFSKLTSSFSPSSRDYHGLRSVSDVGRVTKKKIHRQSSLWY